MSKELSAAMLCRRPSGRRPLYRFDPEGRASARPVPLLLPADAGRRRELPLARQAAVGLDLEAGEIALTVVVGDLDEPLLLGVDHEGGVGQLGELLLGHERDLDLPLPGVPGGGAVAVLEVVHPQEQEVEAGLVLAVDRVAAAGLVLGVPGMD